MDLVDRIEGRRFVGREFLLWLWFESEIFEATLATREHGSFGLWIEGRLALAEGQEQTTIKGSTPGHHREAKESLRRGKLPTVAGLHLSWADHEVRFALKGETLAIAGLALPTVLGDEEDEPPPALKPAAPPRKKKRRGPRDEGGGRDDAGAEADEAVEAFYERMHLTKAVEEILVALYRDFLALRLSSAWDEVVVPTMLEWIAGEEVDADAYREAREGNTPRAKRARAAR